MDRPKGGKSCRKSFTAAADVYELCPPNDSYLTSTNRYNYNDGIPLISMKYRLSSENGIYSSSTEYQMQIHFSGERSYSSIR